MLSSYEKALASHSFLLLAHYASFAMQDLLVEYLSKYKVKEVTMFNLPLPELPYLHHIQINTFSKGSKQASEKIRSFYKPKTLAYILQSVQIFCIFLFSQKKYDIVIAQDSLLAFIAIMLRRLGICKVVVFYSHGVDNTRFGSSFMLKIYTWLDRFCATNSNYNIVLGNKMLPVRKGQGIYMENVFWIPASIPVDSVARKTNIKNHKLIFMGTLNNKNGVYLLPDIVIAIKKRIPDVMLDIMGNGDLYGSLEKRIRELHLEDSIKLFGNVAFKDFAKILTNYACGIVSYEYSKNNLLQMTDPMKLRVYAAAGLPMVITKGFSFSKEVEQEELGFAVEYSIEGFANGIIKILQNEKLAKKLRSNNLSYSKKYDLDKFYKKAFSRILEDKNL